jgi:hypothetical protein
MVSKAYSETAIMYDPSFMRSARIVATIYDTV